MFRAQRRHQILVLLITIAVSLLTACDLGPAAPTPTALAPSATNTTAAQTDVTSSDTPTTQVNGTDTPAATQACQPARLRMCRGTEH